MLIEYSSYQLALPSPGISPRIATSRSLQRDSPNLRYTPRERPVMAQRLRWRLALASRGCVNSAICAASRYSGVDFGVRMISFSCARLAANFFTVRVRRCSRCTILVLAISCPSDLPSRLFSERETEGVEQCPALLVIPRGGRDRDVHAAYLIDRVVLNFGEDDLLAHAHGVVAATIEATRRHPAEVANSRHGHADQAVEELVHACASQRHLAADRQSLAYLEGRDGLLGLADHRLLASDLGQIAGSRIHDFEV